MSPVLTVAICSRNGAQRLPHVLRALVLQAEGVRQAWDLCVIDNASDDGTRGVARAFEGRLPLTVVHEPRLGLSAARNRAVAEARAPVLAFTDDDVTLDDGWLRAWVAAATDHADAGWFGGRVLPAWPEGRPGWVRDETLPMLDGVLGYHAPAPHDRAYGPSDGLPIGANFGLRVAVHREVGPFREDLGLRGDERVLGEETEWLRRAIAAGHPGWHVHGAVVLHPVPRARLTLAALWRHGVASGVAQGRTAASTQTGSRWKATWGLARGTRQWLMGRGDRFRQCVVNAGIEAGLRRERRARDRAGSAPSA